MNHRIILLLIGMPLFLATNTVSAQSVKILPAFTRDLVYDAVTDRVYASVDPVNAVFGNCIGIIDPHSATFDTAVFIGSQPAKLAISDNGAIIHAALNGNGKVRSFDVATRKAGASFALGASPFNGPYSVEDMEIMPGQTDKLAISRRNNCCSPQHEGVALFDNGIQRQLTTQVHTGSNVISFVGEGAIFGLCTESSEFGFRKIGVDDTGLTELWVEKDFVNGYSQNFIVHNKTAYFTNGKVVNLAGPAIDWLGTFSGAAGKVAFDGPANRAAYIKTNMWGGTGPVSIQRFDPDVFTLSDEFSTGITGSVRSFICWGNGRYAFNTEEGEVVIIDYGTSGTDAVADRLEVSATPNPASEQVVLDWHGADMERVSITTAGGRLVLSENLGTVENQLQVNVSNWPTGLYFVHFNLTDGRRACKKLAKT